MIQANELRIGNWVEANMPPMKVMAITAHSVELSFPQAEADGWDEDLEAVNGIPLTPEILIAAGFKQQAGNKNLFFLNEFRYSFRQNFISLLRPCDKAGESQKEKCGFLFITDAIKVVYVHQLQNLYFALTGSELQIVLNNGQNPKRGVTRDDASSNAAGSKTKS